MNLISTKEIMPGLELRLTAGKVTLVIRVKKVFMKWVTLKYSVKNVFIAFFPPTLMRCTQTQVAVKHNLIGNTTCANTTLY